MGEKMPLATDFTPDVRPCVRPFWSREMMVREATTSTINVSVRRDRRDLGTQGRPAEGSAGRGGDQHPFERFEFLEALATADGHAVEGIAGDDDGHPGLVLQSGLQPVQ